MKMNLSVVMSLKDKVSAPLKGMSSDSDYYAKKIKKIQLAQADDSSALALIASYQHIQQELNKNTLEGEEAAEKLLKLKNQMAATEEPSAALTNKLAKQEEKVAQLTDKNNQFEASLSETSKRMKKSGVDVKKLDSEVDRLSKSQIASTKSIDATSKSYKRLKKAMTPITKMNKLIKMPTLQTAKNTAMGAAGVLGTLAGFGVVMSSTAARVNELSKAAGDIQMPVGELQALRMQASGAGAEAEDMDAALKEMSLRWGEMKSLGSGAMNDYFQDTGNKKAYNDLLNAKDAAQAYQVIVREIAKEADVSKQNFMADEFFGGDSEKLLPVLKGGLDDLRQAKQRLNDTGGPIDETSIKASKAFAAGLKKLSSIVDSLKISALTPVMAELSVWFETLATNMKDMDWREEAIEKLRTIVSGTFTALKFMGKAIMFVAENIKGIVAAFLLFKIALIAINAAIMLNPIGLMAAGIAAAVVGIGYLIDRFIGFDVILQAVGKAIGWVWDGIKSMINMLPDALIPDGWKTSLEEAGDEVAKLNGKLGSLKDKNVKLGITTTDTVNRRQNQADTQQHGQQYQTGSMRSPGQLRYQPLGSQTIKSQSEVKLTIQSDKPVSIDKAVSEKGTDLSVNVGNMAMSY